VTPTTAWLRRAAVAWALPGAPGSLAAALDRLDFVQADPIQAPARAQDLILRHRVRGYRAGDLDRRYPALGLDEDVLYAYGYVTPRLRALLHPRHDLRQPDGGFTPDRVATAVLDFVRERGVAHPRDVQAEFGAARATNDWGGTSSATTLLLERLHRYGLVRVADRVAGVRRYAVAEPVAPTLDRAARQRALVLRVARLLAPATESTLSTAVSRLVWWLNEPDAKPGGLPVIRDLIGRGELTAATVDGVRYVWPADLPADVGPAPARVRLLAPFDPLVWDRKRFGQLHGWDYRFEAYTPAAKRRLGYYALPLLWRDRVVGWANCPDAACLDRGGAEIGFAGPRPASRAFDTALAAELGRLRTFLG
jgi:uncharacterized protein